MCENCFYFHACQLDNTMPCHAHDHSPWARWVIISGWLLRNPVASVIGMYCNGLLGWKHGGRRKQTVQKGQTERLINVSVFIFIVHGTPRYSFSSSVYLCCCYTCALLYTNENKVHMSPAFHVDRKLFLQILMNKTTWLNFKYMEWFLEVCFIRGTPFSLYSQFHLL